MLATNSKASLSDRIVAFVLRTGWMAIVCWIELQSQNVFGQFAVCSADYYYENSAILRLEFTNYFCLKFDPLNSLRNLNESNFYYWITKSVD